MGKNSNYKYQKDPPSISRKPK